MPRNPVNYFVARRLQQRRQDLQLTLRDVSRRTGIPVGSLSCLESDRYRINLENLMKLLWALDLPIVDVWPKSRPNGISPKNLWDAFEREMEQEQALRPTFEEVVAQVCKVFKTTREALRSPRRVRRAANARTAVAVIAREYGYPHRITAAYFQRDTSSLSHSLRRSQGDQHFERYIKIVRDALEHAVRQKARAIEMTCKVFLVTRQQLANTAGTATTWEVRMARASLSLLAPSLGVPKSELCRAIAYPATKHFLALGRMALTVLTWAKRKRASGEAVTNRRRAKDTSEPERFEQLFVQLCNRLDLSSDTVFETATRTRSMRQQRG